MKFGYTSNSIGQTLAKFVGLTISDVAPLTVAQLQSAIVQDEKAASKSAADMRAEILALQVKLAEQTAEVLALPVVQTEAPVASVMPVTQVTPTAPVVQSKQIAHAPHKQDQNRK